MASVHLTSAEKLKQIAVSYKTRLFPVEKQKPFRLINDFLRLIFLFSLAPWWLLLFLIFFLETLTQDFVFHVRTDTHSRSGSCQRQPGLHWCSLNSWNTPAGSALCSRALCRLTVLPIV